MINHLLSEVMEIYLHGHRKTYCSRQQTQGANQINSSAYHIFIDCIYEDLNIIDFTLLSEVKMSSKLSTFVVSS